MRKKRIFVSEEQSLKRQLHNLKARFETEKRAKNRAFAFILRYNLLDDYRAYFETYRDGRDPFVDIKADLLEMERNSLPDSK